MSEQLTLSAADAEEYTEALGQVVAGGYRQVALGVRLGVPDALGISTVEWVERRLGGYVRMSIKDRQEAVAELTAEGMTQPEIADTLGVGVGTVNRDLHADDEPEIPNGIDAEPDDFMDEPIWSPDDEPEIPNGIDAEPSLESEAADPLTTRELLAQSLITEGWMRQYLWAIRQRIPQALGMSRGEWTEKYHRPPKLAIEERREEVAGLLEEGLSQAEISDALGVSEPTVSRDVASLSDETPDPTNQVHEVVGDLSFESEPASEDGPRQPSAGFCGK